MDLILIEALELTCIVGMRPQERLRKQSVIIDLELALDLSNAARSGRITNTVDYDLIVSEVRTLLNFREYQLIEGATEEISAMLFGVHPAIQRVRIRIAKPAALAGQARSAAVEMVRELGSYPRRRVRVPFGTAERVLETREASLDLCFFAPGRPHGWREIVPAGHRSVGWVTMGELVWGTTPVRPGDQVPLADTGAPELICASPQGATLFVCASPPLGILGSRPTPPPR